MRGKDAMSATTEPMIVGLDIGSSKIAALAVTYDAEGTLTYVEAVRMPAEGIRGGVVTSIPEATESILGAIGALGGELGRRISAGCLSVGGKHLSSQNLRGVTAIMPRGREIVHEDVARAIAAARAGLPRGENREVLHEIPRAYLVDGQVGVRDPHAMSGYELEVEVHYATGA